MYYFLRILFRFTGFYRLNKDEVLRLLEMASWALTVVNQVKERVYRQHTLMEYSVSF